jgi:arylsulfatase A-like enzyme
MYKKITDLRKRALLPACWLSTGMAWLLLPAAISLAAAPAKQPNIVFILADDLGYGDLGCYGNKNIKTPNIDSLAKCGMRFTNFHVNAPVCSPTRAGFLTGRSHVRCGVDEVLTPGPGKDEAGLPVNETTVAELLKKGGYTTGIFGKWHLGYAEKFNPVNRGFDRFIGHLSGFLDYHSHVNPKVGVDWMDGLKPTEGKGYSTDLIGNNSVEFVKANKEKPFFLFISHQAPHSPYQGPEDGPLMEWKDGKAVKTSEAKQDKDERDAKYIKMVERMDKTIGDLIDAMDEEGLTDNTLVMFVSDNGPSYLAGSAGGLNGGKHTLLEGGIRVPAVAFWPGKIKQGVVTDQPATILDLFPTFLGLAGVKPPSDLELDGIDIGSLLLQGAALPKRTLCWRYLDNVAAMDGKWKLMGQYDRKTRQTNFSGKAVQLYDLAADPAEKVDLAAGHPEIVGKLKTAHEAWEKAVENDRKRSARTQP